MKRNLFLLLVLLATATTAFAQVPPQVIWEMDTAANNLTFSADGATMYTGGLVSDPPFSYGNITKWDVSSRTEIYTLTSGGSEVIGRTNALAVSPDGTAVVSGHGSVRCPAEGPCVNVSTGFHVWDAVSGTSQFALGDDDLGGLVEAVAFSHDGGFVAFGMGRTSDEQISVYKYPEYTLQGTYGGHGAGTYCVAFSPTENLLATGGYDGTVRLWDVDTQQLVRTLAHGSYIDGGYPISVTFSPDGSRLAVTGAGYSLNATVWDVSTGDLVYSLPVGAGQFGTSSATVAFFPNGRYLIAGVSRYVSPEWGGLIRIWDLVDGSLVREYTEETVGAVGSSLFVAVSPASDGWFAYTYDNQVKFAETGLDFEVINAAPVSDQPGLRQLNLRAHPNPFNPMTTISFSLEREQQVRLSVFDMAGKRVVELFQGVMPAGDHPIQWNGRDSTGRGVSSGSYMISLEAEGTVKTSKMMLVR